MEKRLVTVIVMVFSFGAGYWFGKPALPIKNQIWSNWDRVFMGPLAPQGPRGSSSAEVSTTKEKMVALSEGNQKQKLGDKTRSTKTKGPLPKTQNQNQVSNPKTQVVGKPSIQPSSNPQSQKQKEHNSNWKTSKTVESEANQRDQFSGGAAFLGLWSVTGTGNTNNLPGKETQKSTDRGGIGLQSEEGSSLSRLLNHPTLENARAFYQEFVQGFVDEVIYFSAAKSLAEGHQPEAEKLGLYLLGWEGGWNAFLIYSEIASKKEHVLSYNINSFFKNARSVLEISSGLANPAISPYAIELGLSILEGAVEENLISNSSDLQSTSSNQRGVGWSRQITGARNQKWLHSIEGTLRANLVRLTQVLNEERWIIKTQGIIHQLMGSQVAYQ